MRGVHYTLTQIDGVLAMTNATSTCELSPRYNITPGQRAPVALARGASRVCEQMRWGLLPRWRGHGGKRGPLVSSAPIEAVATTPLLRDVFRKQRCLVIADGCYAWRELKQPIWYHPEPRHPIAFAGVWNVSDDDGEPSFALLLGPPLVTRVNDPMPIVLGPESFAAWLDPMLVLDTAMTLVTSAPAPIGWRVDLVSTRMSSGKHDDPSCIEPVGNPNQIELF